MMSGVDIGSCEMSNGIFSYFIGTMRAIGAEEIEDDGSCASILSVLR